ncbi:hypothetical protein F5148DRAFT_977700, partial [Russula earlei]
NFVINVVGKRVVVRLTSGVDYLGMFFSRSRVLFYLSCLDGYMKNIALGQTEEHVNGTVTNRHGDASIRGNNGAMPLFMSCCSPNV